MSTKLTRDKWMSDDEFKELLTAARLRHHLHAIRDYALLAVGGLGGLRALELVSIQVADAARIAERPAVLKVRTAKRRAFVLDEIGLPTHAALALARHLRTLEGRGPDTLVFPLTTRQVGRLFKRYAKLAKLNPKLSAHSLRHHRGVALFAATNDLVLVKESLRHADIRSTQTYVHAVNQAARATAVDVDLPPP